MTCRRPLLWPICLHAHVGTRQLLSHPFVSVVGCRHGGVDHSPCAWYEVSLYTTGNQRGEQHGALNHRFAQFCSPPGSSLCVKCSHQFHITLSFASTSPSNGVNDFITQKLSCRPWQDQLIEFQAASFGYGIHSCSLRYRELFELKRRTENDMRPFWASL